VSATGERIVAQGVEYRGEVTRCWSRWDTGAVTWEDTRTVWSGGPTGLQYASIWHVGSGRGGGPPPGVNMVDVAPLERVDREAPPG
jgi:hypothetical protein